MADEATASDKGGSLLEGIEFEKRKAVDAD